MEKNKSSSGKFDSISDIHQLFDLPKPLHPLISLINNANNQLDLNKLPQPHVLNFYKISFKIKLTAKLRYGQAYYDFEEGGLMFAAPNQVLSNEDDTSEHAGYTLLVHPDFFLGHPMTKKIREYGFFSYDANEALHLSDKEKETIFSIFHMIEEELNSRIDDFSQDVIIAQIELLLNYAERYYKRQFITRRAVNNDLLQKLEALLNEHFTSQSSISKGTPTVQELSEQLHISASYLSDMLRSLTGQNTQQLIHHRLIEKAKEILSTSKLSIAEIAYQLGFEHPQSFSRLFKTKTNLSPLEFRKSFN